MLVSIKMADFKTNKIRTKNTFREKESTTAAPECLGRREPERRDAISQHYPCDQRLVCLPACCCRSSQDPHPHTSRSAFFPAGGWHQALDSRASDSTNTFTVGLNPCQARSFTPRGDNCDCTLPQVCTCIFRFINSALLEYGLLQLFSNKINSVPCLLKN